MRGWRVGRELNEEQRKKARCRSYARVYLMRGKIKRGPCEECGDANSQMHHEDYDKPLKIKWLCRPCHLEHHAPPWRTEAEKRLAGRA